MNIYYVYVYLRESDSVRGKAGSPYYVGKGKGRRAFYKWSGIKPPSNKDNIKILISDLSEQEAFEHEIRLIKEYGRIDLGTGCLWNKTNGGEGGSGVIQTPEVNAKRSKTQLGRPLGPQSEEHRKNNSLSHIGQIAWNKGKKTGPMSKETKKKMSDSHIGRKAWNKGIPMTNESKKKLSDTTKGRIGTPHSEASKKKMSDAHKGQIPWNKGLTKNPKQGGEQI